VSRALRILVLLVVLAAVVVLLFTRVFPWVERRQQDPTMGVVYALRSAR
jgi:hypothetical protein